MSVQYYAILTTVSQQPDSQATSDKIVFALVCYFSSTAYSVNTVFSLYRLGPSSTTEQFSNSIKIQWFSRYFLPNTQDLSLKAVYFLNLLHWHIGQLI